MTVERDNVDRLNWIDFLKGIAIFLVVFGHMPFTPETRFLKESVYSFHMPLFFLLAGCTAAISMNRSASLFSFFKKRCISVLLPYVMWCFAYGIIFSSSVTNLLSYNWKEHMCVLLKGDVINWFLICLFILQLYFVFYTYLAKKVKAITIKILIAIFFYICVLIIHKISHSSYKIHYLTTSYVYFIPFAVGVALCSYRELLHKLLDNKWLMMVCICVSLITPRLQCSIPFTGNHTKIIVGLCVAISLIALCIDNKYINGSVDFLQGKLSVVEKIFLGLSQVFIWIGKYSLGIYLMSSIFLPLSATNANSAIEVFVVYSFFSVIICAICALLENIICKSSILAILFFGKRKQTI